MSQTWPIACSTNAGFRVGNLRSATRPRPSLDSPRRSGGVETARSAILPQSADVVRGVSAQLDFRGTDFRRVVIRCSGRWSLWLRRPDRQARVVSGSPERVQENCVAPEYPAFGYWQFTSPGSINTGSETRTGESGTGGDVPTCEAMTKFTSPLYSRHFGVGPRTFRTSRGRRKLI